MAIPKIIGAQRDFSAGELDVSTKRADESPVMKTGARQMSNWRILSSKALQNRPGRSAIFPIAADEQRVEKVTMGPAQDFYIGFGNGGLAIYNMAGTLVFLTNVRGDGLVIPWSPGNLNEITYVVDRARLQIIICYLASTPLNVPQILTWDGVSQTSTWTITNWAPAIGIGGQVQTAFYRLSPQGVTLLPSGTNGNITITFSSGILTTGMVGTRLTYCGRQLQITARTNATTGSATTIEPLPPSQTLTLGTATGKFQVGDEVRGSISGALGIVTAPPTSQLIYGIGASPNIHVGDSVTGGTSGATGVITQVQANVAPTWIVVNLSGATFFTNGETITDNTTSFTFTAVISGSGASATTMVVQIIPTSANNIALFTTSDLVVGPSGSSTISAVSTGVPQPVATWSDEVLNSYRGWPFACFLDQNRFGFCNIPGLPAAIVWSAIGLTQDLYVNDFSTNVTPGSAILELAPNRSQVFYVIPGMESSEFIFCDNAVYYIPITAAIPLEPGSVAFNQLASFGTMEFVEPRRAEQSIIFMRAGAGQVCAVQVPGAYYRPNIIDNISELHAHLFTASNAVAIAIPSATLQFEELYIYILLANSNLVVGKYAMRQGLIEPGQEGKPHVGWVPWSSAATMTWISAHQDEVTIVSVFNSTTIVEKIDSNQLLDGAVSVNALPSIFTPPGGKGPLFKVFGVNTTVFLIDLGTRFMGTYRVNANGFLIPQFIGGENLSSPQLVAGQPWIATLEPFAPDAPPGQANKQRMIKRRVSHMSVYVSNSTGFIMARLFAGPITPTSPPLGTTMNFRRVMTWNMGDDATQPPPLREEVQRWRPLGRAFDPRVVVSKDTPGSLLVHEIGLEVTI
jgi:hypothetical protein